MPHPLPIRERAEAQQAACARVPAAQSPRWAPSWEPDNKCCTGAVDGLSAHGLEVCFQKSRAPYVGSITMNPQTRWLLTTQAYCPAVKESRGLRSRWLQGHTPSAFSQVGSFLPPPASESPSSLDKHCRLQSLPPLPHMLSSFLPSYKNTGPVGSRAHPILV